MTQSDAWVLIGNGSLLAGCGDLLIESGQRIVAVVTGDAEIRRWAAGHGTRIESLQTDLAALLRETRADHLASIAHLSLIPAEALREVRGLALNFHDGPLPQMAGLNVTSWAILQGARTHGVTWHTMTERADAGRILEQRRFEIAPDETAFRLNTTCYAAGLESFGVLARRIAGGDTGGLEQDFSERQYFGRHARPDAAGIVDWSRSADEISALVRALDFGDRANPLGVAKLQLGSHLVAVAKARAAETSGRQAPGTIVALSDDTLRVATGSGDIELRGWATLDGRSLTLTDIAREAGLVAGQVLAGTPPTVREAVAAHQGAAARSEDAWRRDLLSLELPDLDLPGDDGASSALTIDTGALDASPESAGRLDSAIAAIATLAARRSGLSTFDLAYADSVRVSQGEATAGVFSAAVPLRVTLERQAPFVDAIAAVSEARAQLNLRGPLCADLWAREPQLRDTARGNRLREADVSIGVGVEPPPARLRFALHIDGRDCRLIASPLLRPLAAQLAAIIAGVAEAPGRPLAQLDLMTAAERDAALRTWGTAPRPVPPTCIHELFAEQAARTPDATALIFRNRRLGFRELDQRTNRLARHLRQLGVGPGVLVGIFLQRSFAMVEAVLATLKAGGAYVPLDPTYPADRIAFMAEDAELRFVLSESGLLPRVPSGPTTVVSVDDDESTLAGLSADPVDGGAGPADLAYVIYTSGSTGKPKGVMIEHRNVANFGVGMDERIVASGHDHAAPGGRPRTWLAVTSLSFDISVLELLWTLSRGFAVVLHRDDERESFVAAKAQAPVDFSLFYFSSDEAERAQDKYRFLLEGARFADENGLVAVWTPERHFHAFGGLFPNPAVTSAAVAAVTRRVGIRAGSVVSPLHPALRIAEDWSIVDNLSDGRVGISFAPGWQPNDFVLRPDAFAQRKELMFEQIEQVRRLWRGEALPHVDGTGKTVDVRILPRPIQRELPVWLTIAGNPESFVAAGRIGAHVLTHLLGQTVKETGEKIALYRQAWRDAGHAGEGTVSLMVHTFVGDSDEAVKKVVRSPMKAYLQSAIGLVREAAWSFPTIKQKSIGAGGEFSPDQLTAEEMDLLLDHAFERYYSTSGLFGSLSTARRFVESVRAIGVDEVACLVDFGVPTDLALAHLPQLAQVAAEFRRGAADTPAARSSHEVPETVPEMIRKHGVTHFQCTPTMAQILLQDPAARPALRELRQMLVGGEALPLPLAEELSSLVGTVTNVYGPTETTVWSSSADVKAGDREVSIGRPLANQSLHVLDRDGRLAPPGLAGELHIGGLGVTRGYWKRPELTAERFVPDPFADGRLYRTGDLVRRREDGAIQFLGRVDHQVKIRGHRVELGEIEARLGEHPAVREAVVIARDDGAGADLVAYVVGAGGPFDEAQVRAHLRARVPDYMMPRAFVVLSAFPMTPNRKIDRKALPAPRREAAAIAVEARPEGRLEQSIAAIWCEVLEVPAVGVDTNFADVGGHSLAMVRILGKLKASVNPDVRLVDLFRFTTIRSLARHLAAAGRPDAALEAVATRAASRRAALAGRGGQR